MARPKGSKNKSDYKKEVENETPEVDEVETQEATATTGTHAAGQNSGSGIHEGKKAKYDRT